MRNCPFCGAENPDSASFCSLCLASLREAAGGMAPGGQSEEGAGTVGAQPPGGAYVSPSDFHAMVGETQAGGTFRDEGAFSGGRPAAVAGARVVPRPGRGERNWSRMISAGLKYSLLSLLMLAGSSILVSFLVVGALIRGSESAFYVALGIQFALEAMILVWGDYRASAEAAVRGDGWLCGVICVGALVFFWQPLLAFLLSLLVTGRTLLPQTFSLVGILVAFCLFLPLGALGGWLAERRVYP